MKKLAKVLSLALVLVMVLSLGGTAWADVTVTVATITDKGGGTHNHTFKAIQIFSGVQTDEQSTLNMLGRIDWGVDLNTDVKKNYVITAIKEIDNTIALTPVDTSDSSNPVGSSATEVAEAISTFTQAQAEQFAKKLDANLKDFGITLTAGNNSLATGYYLIVDTTTIGEGDARNASLLQLTQDITVAVKTDIPSQEKKVKDNAPADGDSMIASTKALGTTNIDRGEGYNDVADYSIGDTVPFVIFSRIPNMHYYDTYYFRFHDTMEPGLTLARDSIRIKIGEYEIYKPADDDDHTVGADEMRTLWNSLVSTDGSHSDTSPDCSFHVTFSNLKVFVNNNLEKIMGTTAYTTKVAECTSAGKTISSDDAEGLPIKVSFDAVLNINANVGDALGNINKSKVEYSNNPDEETKHGETPEDKVIVFTYKLDNNKYDGKAATLSSSATYWKDRACNESCESTDAAAKYAMDSSKKYVKIGSTWHELLDGAKFILTKEVSGTTFVAIFDDDQHVIGWTSKAAYNTTAIKANPDNFSNIDQNDLPEGTINNDGVGYGASERVTLIMESGNNGYFGAIGLDEGTYKLVEVAPPEGYNAAADLQFTITATEMTDRQNWTTTSADAITKLEITACATTDGDETTGVVTLNVANNKGISLPETGGVGTTLFYVFGSMLVIAAAVYFVTKKRSEVE